MSCETIINKRQTHTGAGEQKTNRLKEKKSENSHDDERAMKMNIR